MALSKRLISLLLAALVTLSAVSPAQSTKGSTPGTAVPGAIKTEGRCQAKTKSGAQCKRKARAGTQYCYQHTGMRK